MYKIKLGGLRVKISTIHRYFELLNYCIMGIHLNIYAFPCGEIIERRILVRYDSKNKKEVN